MKQQKPLLTDSDVQKIDAFVAQADERNRKRLARAKAKAKKPARGHLMWHVPAGARVCGPWSIPSWNY
jgi:hypothetical protein